MAKVMIELVNSTNLAEAQAYLASHEETSQFLINNLRQFGPSLNDHHNSGNFKILRGSRGVEGVFCLPRRGNLLVQANADYSEAILRACSEEPISVKGFIGEWNSIAPVWLAHKKQNPSYRPVYESKEVLFSLPFASAAGLKHDPRVRFLEKQDFEQWNAFSTAYMAELDLPDDLSEEKKRKSFEDQIGKKHWWGMFLGDELVSRTSINSGGEEIGQVGGVFTPDSRRKMGYGVATMLHMLKDCRDFHGHRKSILITGETNIPAQKLYESIGYERKGSFALILG